MKHILTPLLLLTLTTSAFAVENVKGKQVEFKQASNEQVKSENTNLDFTKINNITSSYNITHDEYSKYLQLKEQYQGLVSPDITPLEYLGIFAKTPKERAKYAKLYTKINRVTTEKVLAFDRAVQVADKEMFGLDNVINYQVRSSSEQPRNRYSVDITNCQDDCKNRVIELTSKAFLTPVDLYFVNASDEQIRSFAASLSLDSEEVSRGLITLNHAK